MSGNVRGAVISLGLDYSNSDHTHLPSTVGDAARIGQFFTESGFKIRTGCDSLAAGTARAVVDFLEEWSDDARLRSPGSRIVIYVAGHARLHNGRHYVLTPTSPPLPPYSSSKAVATEDIVHSILNSGAIGGLIMLDTCYSACGADDVQRALDRAASAQGIPVMDVAVLVPSLHYQKSYAGLFVEELLNALEYGSVAGHWRDGDEFVTLYDLRNELRSRLNDEQCAYVAGRDGLKIVPNPRYRADAADRSVEIGGLLASLPQSDRDHFLRKASAALSAGEDGWLFVGRRTLSRTLLQLLASERHGLFVVTGAPGSGKSAFLGRLAVLADPASRPACRALGMLDCDESTRPAVGLFDAVIHMRKLRTDDVAHDLAEQLEVDVTESSSPARDLVEYLIETGRPVTILADALDEAESGEESQIARDVLRAIGSLPSCKVVVGTRVDRDGSVGLLGVRSPLVDSLRPRKAPFHVLNLDADGEADADIEGFVKDRLQHSGTWTSEERRSAAAEEVARQAARNFLYARFALRAVEQLDETVIDDPQWNLLLPNATGNAGLNDVFEQDLQRFDDPVLVREVLAPLAFARGKGLPRRRLWPELATALSVRGSSRAYSAADVSRVIRDAGWYLTEATEYGESVFRLYHQSIAEYLQTGVNEWRMTESAKD